MAYDRRAELLNKFFENLETGDSDTDRAAIVLALLIEAVANAELEIRKLRAELTGRESLVELIK